jgi:hypothetical protein
MLQAMARMVSGALGGITAILFTYPLDLVRTRLVVEVQPSRGVLDSLKAIFRKVRSSSSLLSFFCSSSFVSCALLRAGRNPRAVSRLWCVLL